MSTLIEDYLREVSTSLRVDAARKRQIVDELRTHLTERVDDEARQDPGRSRFDVERDVLRDFGNPRDLALAYEPEGAPILRNAMTGETVLRVGRAAARGTGKVLKWTAIALAGLLVVALGVGAWAYYEVKPYIPSIIEQNEPTYQYFERCAQTPCSGAPPADVFHVREDAKTVRFALELYPTHLRDDWTSHVGNGTVSVKVVDPMGETRYDRTFNASDEGGVYYEASWAAVAGNWSIEYRYDAFVGALEIETYAISVPWADER